MSEIEILNLEQNLKRHLTEGLTLPVNLAILPVCKLAIELCNKGEFDTIVELPKGFEFWDLKHTWTNTCPASQVIISFSLYSFINPEVLQKKKAQTPPN